MTYDEMEIILQETTDERNIDVLVAYLNIAGGIILKRLYPFGSDVTEVPECYRYRQLEIATYLINKQGAEGQISHSENGISRSYESASVPESMLKDITPYASVFGY